MTLTVVSRGGWKARPPKNAVATTAVETFLHHSVGYGTGGAAYMRQMQNQHMDDNGWADIAYNFVIDPKTLVVYEGRGWGVRPGSQKSYNTGTWSVCVMGNFSSWTPSEGLLTKIVELIRHGYELDHIPLILTGGHRDAPGQATTCPGNNLYGSIETIRNLLVSSPMKRRIQDWARPAYEWAIATRPTRVYQATSVSEIRETIDDQREMVFLWRAVTNVEGDSGPGEHDHDGRYVKDVESVR